MQPNQEALFIAPPDIWEEALSPQLARHRAKPPVALPPIGHSGLDSGDLLLRVPLNKGGAVSSLRLGIHPQAT